MSGGQQQMLAIGRAMMARPTLPDAGRALGRPGPQPGRPGARGDHRHPRRRRHRADRRAEREAGAGHLRPGLRHRERLHRARGHRRRAHRRPPGARGLPGGLGAAGVPGAHRDRWPPDAPEEQRDGVFAASWSRGSGWRARPAAPAVADPRRWANWSLYDVADATELHEALTRCRSTPGWTSRCTPSPSTPTTREPWASARRPCTTRGPGMRSLPSPRSRRRRRARAATASLRPARPDRPDRAPGEPGAEGPRALETEADVAPPRRRCWRGSRRPTPRAVDAFLPDCVLDPVVGTTTGCRGRSSGSAGSRRASSPGWAAHGAVARNRAIAEELDRKLARVRRAHGRADRGARPVGGGHRRRRRLGRGGRRPGRRGLDCDARAERLLGGGGAPSSAAGRRWWTPPRPHCGCWAARRASGARRGRAMSPEDGGPRPGRRRRRRWPRRCAARGLARACRCWWWSATSTSPVGNNTAMSTAMVPGAGSRVAARGRHRGLPGDASWPTSWPRPTARPTTGWHARWPG